MRISIVFDLVRIADKQIYQKSINLDSRIQGLALITITINLKEGVKIHISTGQADMKPDCKHL